MGFKEGLFHKPIFHILWITITGLLIYSNTFNAPLQFDDRAYITDDPIIKDIEYFIYPSKAKEFRNSILSFYYASFKNRFVGNLTFALNYKLHGTDVTGYHTFNLIVHILNAILVYYLVILTSKTPYFSPLFNSPLGKGGYRGVALFSSLLFLSHPIQTQAVTYVVQRFTSLATLFYLLSLVMYIKWRLKIEQQTSRAADYQKKRKNYYTVALLLYCTSLISAILAMKTKEIAFTLPFIIALYEFSFFNTSRIKHYASRFLYLLPFYLILILILLDIVGIDKSIGDTMKGLQGISKETAEISRWSYLFTQFRVVVTYIRLLFFPMNQNLDYDYQVYHSFLKKDVFLSFLFLLLIFGLGIYLFYRSRRNPPSPRFNSPLLGESPVNKGGYRGVKEGMEKFSDFRLISFGIFWFFITLSVESSIIPIRDVIFEHRLYLPSVGITIALISLIFYVLRFKIGGLWITLKASYLLLTTIIIALLISTYQRNLVWQDEVRFWEDVVKKSPRKARGYNELGRAYQQYEHTMKAIQMYETALRLDTNYEDAYNNLGRAYRELHLTDKAIEHFQTLIKLNQTHIEAHFNLGIIFLERGNIDSAREEFETVLKINPYYNQAARFLEYINNKKSPSL